VGAILSVAGLMLAYFPLAQQDSSSQYIPSATSEYVIDYSAPLDLLFPRVLFTLSWTASALQTNISVRSCGGDANCGHPAGPLATGHGRNGSLDFRGSANTYYLIVPAGGSANFTISYATPLLGGSAGFGVFLAGLAMVVFSLTPPRPAPTEEGDDP
jgi:hypothetical protein